MNPPFSASPHIQGRFAEAAIRHLGSALARLADGGRLVAITGHSVGPDQPAWRDAFVRLKEKGRVVFTTTIAGKVYARHGTNIDTRLTVIDRIPAEDPRYFPPSSGMAADFIGTARTGFNPGSGTSDDQSTFCPPRPRHVSGARSHSGAAENIRTATVAR